jgi:hypothetical protein
MGVANVQFFGNDGLPLTNGCLYVYAAGTSTQAASYTDSTGNFLNTNPVCFGAGARATVWLTTANFYKLQLCAANDGAFCSAGNLLFSVDNLPGGASSSGGGASCGTGCIGFFISGTASPATSGVLRMASGDSFGWRNAAGSANLLFSKDANDQLGWAGGSVKFPLVGAPACVAGFSQLWSDNSANRWKACGNGGAAAQLVFSGNDISTTDSVTALHFGATQTPIGSTSPTPGQALVWNGTNIVGGGPKLENANFTPVTVTNTAGETNLMTFTLGANEITTVGQVLRFTMRGIWATGATPPSAATFKLKSDAVVLAASPANIAVSAGTTNIEWEIHVEAICVSTGGSGTFEIQGGGIGGASAYISMMNTNVVTVDTTVSHTIAFTVTGWNGVAGDVITERQMIAERLM